MFLLKDSDYIYLLRGTTASLYMSKQLYRDAKEAIELGFTLSEIVVLLSNDLNSIELLKTSFEIYEKFATDAWNWHKWALDRNFNKRFYTCISRL